MKKKTKIKVLLNLKKVVEKGEKLNLEKHCKTSILVVDWSRFRIKRLMICKLIPIVKITQLKLSMNPLSPICQKQKLNQAQKHLLQSNLLELKQRKTILERKEIALRQNQLHFLTEIKLCERHFWINKSNRKKKT